MATSADPPPYQEVVKPTQIPPATETVVHRPAQDDRSTEIVVDREAPDYDYVPSDYIGLSSVLSVLCCLFSPIALLFTLPALALSLSSRNANLEGKWIRARTTGLVAAYLNVCAVFFAFVVGIVATILVITLSPGSYWR